MTENRLQAVRSVLLARYCDKRNGRLGRWPSWLRNSLLVLLEDRGYLRHEFYQNLWGHTEYWVL